MSTKTDLFIEDLVQVITGEGDRDPSTYKITALTDDDELASIIAIDDDGDEITDDPREVHRSRIAAVIRDGEVISLIEEEKEAKRAASKVKGKISKQKGERKRKDKETVSLETLSESGEIWSREITSFNHDTVNAVSHCQIMKDGETFWHFNTFNGSLGNKGGSKKTYEFKNLEAVRKKRRALQNKGYELTHPCPDMVEIPEDQNEE